MVGICLPTMPGTIPPWVHTVYTPTMPVLVSGACSVRHAGLRGRGAQGGD